MQGGHATLTFRIHLCENRLRAIDRFVVEPADQIFCRGPGLLFGTAADDHVQYCHASRMSTAAPRFAARAFTSATFFATSAGGSPHVR